MVSGLKSRYFGLKSRSEGGGGIRILENFLILPFKRRTLLIISLPHRNNNLKYRGLFAMKILITTQRREYYVTILVTDEKFERSWFSREDHDTVSLDHAPSSNPCVAHRGWMVRQQRVTNRSPVRRASQRRQDHVALAPGINTRRFFPLLFSFPLIFKRWKCECFT